ALVDTPDSLPEKSGALSKLIKASRYTAAHPLRVAFLYDRAPEHSGWVYGHELGRNHLGRCFDGAVETLRFDQCGNEEAFQSAVEAAASDEDDLVITVSPSQMPMALRAAGRFPKLKFLNCSVNMPYHSVRTFYGRMYEAKFLMGALAACCAPNHRIGYQAGMPVYGTIADINAFAIGAAMIDPQAKIYLKWSAEKDNDWHKTMYEEGISVMSGPEMVRPEKGGREYGIYQYDESGSLLNLAMPVHDWGVYYEKIVESLLSGAWNAPALNKKDQALNFWWGMSAGVIDVILSRRLSYYTVKLVQTLKNGVITDVLNPFDGELHSQSGLVKPADSPRLTEHEIITMDWLNDNIIGTIPEVDQLTGSARESVAVNGIAGTANRP
ncbi:MAG: BMP family ABC transporter substrate-binding protein, partial [Eubacterium sp.]|nr:BMP family ABC transporter substrate-binding protein [Eubacterium sp.]